MTISIKELSTFIHPLTELPELLMDAIEKKVATDATYNEFVQNFMLSPNGNDKKYGTVYFRDTIALPHRELFATELDWHNAWIPIDSAMLHYTTDIKNKHKIKEKLERGEDALFIKGDKFFKLFAKGKNKYDYKVFENEDVYFGSEGEDYLNKEAWEGKLTDLLDDIGKTYPSYREITYFLDTTDLHSLYHDNKIYQTLILLKEGDLENATDRIQENMYFNNELIDFIEKFDNPKFKEEITPTQEVLSNAQITGMKKQISHYIAKADLKEVAIFIKWNSDRVSTDDVPEKYRDTIQKLIKNREPIKLAAHENNSVVQKKDLKL